MEFAVINDKSGLPCDRRLNHAQPVIRGRNSAVPVGWVAVRQKTYFGEFELAVQLERGSQVTVMYRVERAAKNTNRIHRPLRPAMPRP